MPVRFFCRVCTASLGWMGQRDVKCVLSFHVLSMKSCTGRCIFSVQFQLGQWFRLCLEQCEGHFWLKVRGGVGRDVLEERRHSPFQVLDASAIEGFRGLAGESSSIYSCIQIYKALTPPAPPSVSRRDGRT